MKTISILIGLLTITLIFGVSALRLSAAPSASSLDPAWKTFFPVNAQIHALTNMPAGDEAFTVRNATNGLLGWAFHTDKVTPAIRGKRGEITLLVALAQDRKILGIKVLSHKEDKKWFDKIPDTFFASFKNHNATGKFDDIQTITGATVSSRAIIKDVSQSIATVLNAADGKAPPPPPQEPKPAAEKRKP